MSKTKTYQYLGFSYTQGDSEQKLLSFCASAQQIKAWAGIPAKTARFHGGFQRALSQRYRKIISFFEKHDISPTSIIVAFHGATAQVTELGYPPGWVSEEDLTYQPQFAHISFDCDEFDVDDADVYALAERVALHLEPRLHSEPAEQASDVDENENATARDDDDDDEDEDDEGVDGDSSERDDLDIGESRLREFYDFVRQRDKIKSWLDEQQSKFDELKKKKKKKKKDRIFLKETPEQRLKSLLVSLLKPAMIVDGQHRVAGASQASTVEDVVFSVCALQDANWVEQVFQFVVLNKLAKPISSDFLTGLLNTSLTNSEIKDIEPRLERIGIRNTDRIIMKHVNYDPESPFHDMVAPAGEVVGASKGGRLSGRGMIRIAKRWRSLGSLTPKKRKKEFGMFARCLGGKTQKARANSWLEKEWVNFFFAFWDVIRKKYEPEQIWVKAPNFHLLMIVTMYELQDYFIETKSDADAQFASLDDFREQVGRFFEDVPAAFFQNWARTGLQSGDGPEHIRSALVMFKKGSQLKQVHETNPLFQAIP